MWRWMKKIPNLWNFLTIAKQWNGTSYIWPHLCNALAWPQYYSNFFGSTDIKILTMCTWFWVFINFLQEIYGENIWNVCVWLLSFFSFSIGMTKMHVSCEAVCNTAGCSAVFYRTTIDKVYRSLVIVVSSIFTGFSFRTRFFSMLDLF